MAYAAVVTSKTEIEADTFGMADVQVAVWLRRKPGFNSPAPFTGAIILVDDIANEIGNRRDWGDGLRDYRCIFQVGFS